MTPDLCYLLNCYGVAIVNSMTYEARIDNLQSSLCMQLTLRQIKWSEHLQKLLKIRNVLTKISLQRGKITGYRMSSQYRTCQKIIKQLRLRDFLRLE